MITSSLVDFKRPIYYSNNFIDFSRRDSRAHSTEIAEIFIAVIYPKSKEALFSRVIKQTIASLSDEFTSATNLKVVAEYTAILDAPNFNAPQPVEQMCQQWNNKPIVAALVLSPFRTAFGHVIASLHNNIPILWATAEVQPGYFDRVRVFDYFCIIDDFFSFSF